MNANAVYAQGLGRALVGAALFALPLLMTMEMWELGATGDRGRIALMLVAFLPILVALSYFAGFERAFGLTDHLLDALAAIAVAVVMSAVMFALFGVFTLDQPLGEALGKLAVMAPPAAIGALLADKQLGRGEKSADAEARSYLARLSLMAVGAIFVAFNVAPTEEMVLIASQISAAQAALLACVSILCLHAMLFWADLPGREGRRGETSFFSVLFRYSFAGYGVCVTLSAALLWVFGRLDNVGAAEACEYVIVLSFPAALGAGIAQSIIGERRGAQAR